MKIATNRPQVSRPKSSPNPERIQAKVEYQQTQDKCDIASGLFSEKFNKATCVSTPIVMGGGLGVWALGVAAVTAVAPPTIGLVIGGLLAAQAGLSAGCILDKITEKITDKYLAKSQAGRAEAYAEKNLAALKYREALMTEMDDPGVIEATKYGFEIDVKAGRAIDVERLERLADSRHKEGWEGKLAHLDDSPSEFGLHKFRASEHKNPELLVEHYERSLETGLKPSLAFEAARRATRTA